MASLVINIDDPNTAINISKHDAGMIIAIKSYMKLPIQYAANNIPDLFTQYMTHNNTEKNTMRLTI